MNAAGRVSVIEERMSRVSILLFEGSDKEQRARRLPSERVRHAARWEELHVRGLKGVGACSACSIRYLATLTLERRERR